MDPVAVSEQNAAAQNGYGGAGRDDGGLRSHDQIRFLVGSDQSSSKRGREEPHRFSLYDEKISMSYSRNKRCSKTSPTPRIGGMASRCVTITMRDRHRAPGLSKKVPLTPKIVVPEKTKQRIIEKLKFGYRRFAKAGKPMYWTLSESLRRALYHEIQSPKLRERLMSLPNLMNPNASRIAEEQRRKFLKLDEKEENDKHLELKLKLNRSRTRERMKGVKVISGPHLEDGIMVENAYAFHQTDEEQGKKPALLAAISCPQPTYHNLADETPMTPSCLQ
eukprot:jgi/Bigna1/131616/aug1.15_g6324